MERNDNLEQRILNLILNSFILNNKEEAKAKIRGRSEVYEEPLTGDVFGINGTELVYLFFEIQKAFHVHIDAQCVCNYEFMTVHGIAELIRQIQGRNTEAQPE